MKKETTNKGKWNKTHTKARKRRKKKWKKWKEMKKLPCYCQETRHSAPPHLIHVSVLLTYNMQPNTCKKTIMELLFSSTIRKSTCMAKEWSNNAKKSTDHQRWERRKSMVGKKKEKKRAKNCKITKWGPHWSSGPFTTLWI